jgi:2-methylcitrate dehydratase PrpD
MSGEGRGLTLALAERSSALAYEAVPEDVLEIARQCLLDWLGVTLGGSSQEGPTMLLEMLTAEQGKDQLAATIVGHQARVSPLRAALLNGTSSHVLDFDDVNIALLAHFSAAILAGTLALGEELDADVSELLSAFVAGYETACRVAVALGPEPYLRGFHSTGTIGTLGAAAACARLLGLDAPRTAAAIGIAASEAAGLKCNSGTMTKSLHAGKACENGLLAALLAARGFTASQHSIEAEQGLVAAAAGRGDTAAALSDPPAGWHLRENLFKYHASCFLTHSTIEGLRDLKGSEKLAIEDIEGVVVHVSDLELGICVIAAPRTGLEVKFSLAHLAAMALLERSTNRISDEDAGDAEVIELRSRVAIADGARPGEPTRVEVALRDGRVLKACHDVNRPERDLGLQRRRLSDKFLILAEPVLGEASAGRLLAALTDLDGGQRIRALMALARP